MFTILALTDADWTAKKQEVQQRHQYEVANKYVFNIGLTQGI